jgi:hypothetical protein
VSWVGAIGYGGLFGLLPQFLEQIRGLGAQDTGLLLWPAAVAAVAGAGLVGVLFATRWITALGLSGLLLLDAGAWLLTRLSAPTGDGRVMLVAFVLGLGASVSVAPGMFVAALRLPGADRAHARSDHVAVLGRAGRGGTVRHAPHRDPDHPPLRGPGDGGRNRSQRLGPAGRRAHAALRGPSRDAALALTA